MNFFPIHCRLNSKLENKHIDDSWKQVSSDNVWVGRYYQWRVYSVPEAIACHRETHDPTMYNVPNAPLNVHIELYMQGEKKTRFVENFSRIALTPHKFDHGEERTVLFFGKSQEVVQEAQNAGATLAGGVELIKDVQNGNLLLSDYQYILAHPNILAELVALRGLMKKKFPNPKGGTLGTEVEEMVQRYLNGIQYRAVKDEYQQDFGLVEACIGTLNMDPKHLEENLIYLLRDIDKVRPRRDGRFITRVLLKSPPSGEQLKINPFTYISENYVKTGKTQETEEVEDADDDSAETKEKQEAAN